MFSIGRWPPHRNSFKRELFPDSFFATMQSSFEVTQSSTRARTTAKNNCTEVMHPNLHTQISESFNNPSLHHLSQCPSPQPSPQQGEHLCHQDMQKHHDTIDHQSSCKTFPNPPYRQTHQTCRKLCTPDFFKNSKNLLSDVNFQFLQSPLDTQSAFGGFNGSGHEPSIMIKATQDHTDQSLSKETSQQSSCLQEEQKHFPVPKINNPPSVSNITNDTTSSSLLSHNPSVEYKPTEKIHTSTDNSSSVRPKCFISTTVQTDKNCNSKSTLITSFSSNCWAYNPSVENQPSAKTQNSTDISPSGWPKCFIPVAEKSLTSENFPQDIMSDTGTFSPCSLTQTTSVPNKRVPLDRTCNTKSNIITSFSSNCWAYNPSVENKPSEKTQNSTDISPSGWPKCFIPVTEKSLQSEENQNLTPSSGNSSACCWPYTTSIENIPLQSENVKDLVRKKTASSGCSKCYTSVTDKHS